MAGQNESVQIAVDRLGWTTYERLPALLNCFTKLCCWSWVLLVGVSLLDFMTSLIGAMTATYFPLFGFLCYSWSGEGGEGGRACQCWRCYCQRFNHVGGHQLWRINKNALLLRLTGLVIQPSSDWMDCSNNLSCRSWVLLAGILLLDFMTSLVEAVTATLYPKKPVAHFFLGQKTGFNSIKDQVFALPVFCSQFEVARGGHLNICSP